MSTVIGETGTTRSHYKLSFFRILRSEWIKLFSVRSTWWILSIAIVLNVGIILGLTAALRFTEKMLQDDLGKVIGPDGVPIEIEPGAFGLLSANVVQSCGFVGQLIFIILSILIITNEYSSGMIRSTFAAAPRRGRVLIAKMIVISIICILVFAISLTAGWWGSYLMLQDSVAVDLTLTSDTSLRILGGFVAEMVLISLFCFGLGAFIRSTAGSIGAAIGIIFILPLIMSVLVGVLSSAGEPTGWLQWLVDGVAFLPTNAGGLVTQAELPEGSILGPWEGLGVLGAWAVLSNIIAFITTARRDV